MTYTNTHDGEAQRSTSTLADLLQTTSGNPLRPIARIAIAHKLATAVLQFHSTAWLKPRWELKHLSFFQDNGQVGEALKRTFCLSAIHPRSDKTAQPTAESQVNYDNNALPTNEEEIPHSQKPRSASVDANASTIGSPPPIHKALLYGLDNETLCTLGIALLEIAYCKPIESLRREGEPSNIYSARRLAQYGTMPLGPKYQTSFGGACGATLVRGLISKAPSCRARFGRMSFVSLNAYLAWRNIYGYNLRIVHSLYFSLLISLLLECY